MNNSNPRLFFTEIYTLKNPKPKSQYQFKEHNRHMSNTVQKLSLQKMLSKTSGDPILQHNLSNQVKYKFLLSKWYYCKTNKEIVIKKRPSDDRRKYEQKNYVFAFFVLKNPQSTARQLSIQLSK